MTANQTPRTEQTKTYFLKACPRCTGDVGRFPEPEGDVFKCLACSREVNQNVLRRK